MRFRGPKAKSTPELHGSTPAGAHVLISAHRCNTPEAVRQAAQVGADYAEFDVRRAGDGTLVCSHDPVPDATDGRCSATYSPRSPRAAWAHTST